eukprot:2209889-Prymnesium_polylepis.1
MQRALSHKDRNRACWIQGCESRQPRFESRRHTVVDVLDEGVARLGRRERRVLDRGARALRLDRA